jgi:hypothetical protein
MADRLAQRSFYISATSKNCKITVEPVLYVAVNVKNYNARYRSK